MNDPLKIIFDSISTDGVLRTETEYNNFIKKLQENGIIKDAFEFRFFEKVWEDEVITKKKWHLGQEDVNDAQLTFKILQKKIIAEFGGLVKGAPEIKSNLDEMEHELESLGELIKRWCYYDNMNKIQTKQLLAMISDLEVSFSTIKNQTEKLVVHQRILMEACKLKTLLKDHFIKSTSSDNHQNSNPFLFQRDYQSLIESHMYRRKLRSVHPSIDIMTSSSSSTSSTVNHNQILKSSLDIFGLNYQNGKNYHYIGTIKQKNGSRKEVDITAVEVHKRANKYKECWCCYEAHRQLHFSRYFIDCFGVDSYHHINKTTFYYEYIQNSTISISRYFALINQMNSNPPTNLVSQSSNSKNIEFQRTKSSIEFMFNEFTPLCQHWICSSLYAYSDIDKMCTFDVLTLPTIEHFKISNQGASFYVGNILWKLIDPTIRPLDELLKQRTAKLLKGWADFVDDLLSYSTPTNHIKKSTQSQIDNKINEKKININKMNEINNKINKQHFIDNEIKVYYESDIYSGGIYANPGEVFDIVLQHPDSKESWYYPTLSHSLGLTLPPPISIQHGNSIHPIPSQSDDVINHCCRIRCEAIHSGRCQLKFSTNLTPSNYDPHQLTIPITIYSSSISPTLIALLRSCRSIENDGTPSMSFSKLCSHEYFSNPPQLDEITANFIAV